MHFNPRPRVGGDQQGVRGRPLYCYFNPRPRVGGDLPLNSAHASC